jgi:hypothetical protein
LEQEVLLSKVSTMLLLCPPTSSLVGLIQPVSARCEIFSWMRLENAQIPSLLAVDTGSSIECFV